MIKHILKLLARIPFLNKRRDCGNYHPIWDRLCYCRVGKYCGGWHGGVQDLTTGKELFPQAYVLETLKENALGRNYGTALEKVSIERCKVMKAIIFYIRLRDQRTELFRLPDAISEMHAAIDRMVAADGVFNEAWKAVANYDAARNAENRANTCEHCSCRTSGSHDNEDSNARH